MVRDPVFRQRTIAGILLGVGSALAIFLLGSFFLTDVLEDFEAQTLDFRYFVKFFVGSSAEDRAPIEEIVIVDIDSRSLYKLGRYHQWPRSYHARVVDYLSGGGASAVFFDVIFAEPDRDPEEDRRLVEATAKAGNVYYVLSFSPADSANFLYEMVEDPVAAVKPDAGHPLEGPPPTDFPSAQRVEHPFLDLMKAARGVAAVNWVTPGDRVVRRFPLFQVFCGRLYPAIGLRMAVDYVQKAVGLNQVAVRPLPGKAIVLEVPGGTALLEIPVDRRGGMWIKYKGPFKTFRYVSYYDVLERRLPARFFEGKIVMIGASAAGLGDLSSVPFQSAYPRVEIHASVLYNILQEDFLVRHGRGTALLTLLAFGLVVALLAVSVRPFWSVIGAMVLGTGYFFLALFLFEWGDLWIEMVRPGLTLMMAFACAMIYRYVAEEREKRQIRGAFQHYVSREIIDEILKDPDQLKPRKRVLSVLFSDIKGFSRISESLDPNELTELMNEYLGEMTKLVFKYNGTLDKYVGDMVVAIYGAPISYHDHEKMACNTALEMVAHLKVLSERFRSEGRPSVDAGVGINTGPMTVGNMGSEVRFAYTVLGDNVNLASRLEGLSRYYRNNIIIGEDTWNAVSDEFVGRPLDLVQVKGKQKPTKIYELIGRRGEVSEDALEQIRLFEEGLALYFARRWDEAIDLFEEVRSRNPQDNPAEVYLERCQDFKEHPLPEDWNGVWVMETK